MIRIKIGRNAWLKILFASCIVIALFGSLRVYPSMPLFKIQALIDNLQLKYILEVVSIFVGLIVCYKKPEKRKLSNINMAYEAKNMLFAIFVMGLITVVFQAINGFYAYSYVELSQWGLPILFVFVLVNVFDDDFEFCFDVALYLIAFLYLYYFGRKFTIQNFRSISFIDSASPFEGGFAFYTCILINYFLYKRKRGKAFICLIITVLSFKRIAMIFSIAEFIFYGFIRKRKPVSPILINAAKAFFIMVPLIIAFIGNEQFARWFNDNFGIDIYKLTLSRFEMITVLLNSDDLKYGLGSTIKVLDEAYSHVVTSGVANHVNVHNDILRIYLDTTIIGTVVYTCCGFNIAKKCYASFVLMLYMFTDMMFNHMNGSGSVTMGILFYLSIYYFNKESSIVREQQACIDSYV